MGVFSFTRPRVLAMSTGFTPSHAQTSRDAGFFLQNTVPLSSGRIAPTVKVAECNLIHPT